MGAPVSNDELKRYFVDHNLDAISLLIVAETFTLIKVGKLAKEFMASDPSNARAIKETLQDVFIDVNSILDMKPTINQIVERSISPQKKAELLNLKDRITKK